MPARYRIYTEHSFVHTVAYGVLRREEMLAHAQALAADASFSPIFSQLVDFRPANASSIGAPDIRALAAGNPFSRTACRVALVDATYVFGMLRMYELMTSTEGQHTLVTRSEADAWAFLRVPSDVLHRHPTSTWDSGAGP